LYHEQEHNGLTGCGKRACVTLSGRRGDEDLVFLVENKQKADPSCRLQQGLQAEIGTSLHSVESQPALSF
jgi:hypothetical protein